jgi:diguanylate cyclase (GGDEF)-like protein
MGDDGRADPERTESMADPRAGDGAPGGARLAREAAQLLSANRRLREASQRRQELLARVAQDLAGPASSLARQAGRLAQGPGVGREITPRVLKAIERHAARISSVAQDLLSLRALERDPTPVPRRPTELGHLVARVAEGRRAAASARAITIACEAPPYPLTVPGDEGRIADLVGALLDVALAATPRGGRVRALLEPQPTGVRLTVEDGRTARQPLRHRVPRRIERLAGAGIGLSICRTLAEAHGGTLEVVARGRGRAALVTLPATVPEPHAEPVRQAPAQPKSRILVVDDDGDARATLSMVLGDDYDTLVAGDGHEATEIAVATRPDLVLMDLYMPRMDGLAALEALRADPLTASLPVILISARGDDLTRSRSLDLGAVDFLQKPFSGRELKARIERTLRFTRRESHLQELARTDPLTGLANVRAFRARLDEEVKRSRRYRTPLACVMIDLDRLKPINDELGHAAGDAAIGSVAQVIRNELRETDFGARYGGDEFVVLLPHTSASEARVFAERIALQLRQCGIEASGRRVPLSASFGIAALDEEPLDDPCQTLVRRADAALYEAKHAGRGRVAAHAPSGGGDGGGAAASP